MESTETALGCQRKVTTTFAASGGLRSENDQGFLQDLDVDYETLSKLNPRLIWGNITGYGNKGPDKDHPAYDTTAYWARAGIPYMLSLPNIPCVGYRPAMGDNVAGLALAYYYSSAGSLLEKILQGSGTGGLN